MIAKILVMLLFVVAGVLLATRERLSVLPLPENEESLYGDLEHHTLHAQPNYLPMSYFSRNRVSPACCPAMHSTAGGCICMTPEQAEQLRMRG